MDSQALQLYRGDSLSEHRLPVRGIGWVLRWAAAIAVLAFTILVLVAFAYQLSAEAALRRAAAAGMREAALPRSTSDSVAAVVRQQLSGRPQLQRALQLQLAAGGVPIRGPIEMSKVSPLSLSLAVPTANALPRPLGALAGDSLLRVRIERPTPIR